MTAAAQSSSRTIGERELIVLMAILMSLQAFGIDAMLPALGIIAEDLGAVGNERQMVISSYFLGAGAGALFPGVLADRYGRRPVLAFSLAAYVSLSVACALAVNFDQLLLVRFLQGATCAGLSVVPAAIVRDRVGGDRMARLMSQIMMIFLIVPILAPGVGQLILNFADWEAIFISMAVMGGLVAVWMWARLPETLEPENVQAINLGTIGGNMREALFSRQAIGYVVGSGLVFGSLFGWLNSSQQLISDTFGRADDFFWIFGGAVLGMVLANLTNSLIVVRFGARRVSHTALFLFLGSALLQVWSASQPDQTLWQFIPIMSFNMAMLGFVGANFSSIAMQPFAHIAGAASSVHAALRMVVGALLGALIGNLYDGTAQPLALSMVVCSLASLAVVLYSERGKLFTRPNARS